MVIVVAPNDLASAPVNGLQRRTAEAPRVSLGVVDESNNLIGSKLVDGVRPAGLGGIAGLTTNNGPVGTRVVDGVLDRTRPIVRMQGISVYDDVPHRGRLLGNIVRLVRRHRNFEESVPSLFLVGKGRLPVLEFVGVYNCPLGEQGICRLLPNSLCWE